jgi:TolB protein
VNVDGTGFTRLIDHPAHDHQPLFIPGSDRVAFVSYRNGDEDIYVTDSDGTGLTNLTQTDWASENSPSFSSDGTKMAYASKRYDRSGYLVNEVYVKQLHGAD